MRLDLVKLAQEVTTLDLKATSQMTTWRQQLLVEINRKASANDVVQLIGDKMDASTSELFCGSTQWTCSNAVYNPVEAQELLATKVDIAQMESQAKVLTQRIEQMQEAIAADVVAVKAVASAKVNAVDIEKLDQNMVRAL